MTHSVRIGTSGWIYRAWRGSFYPEDLPQRQWLGHLAEHLDTAELNGTFYSLKRPSDYRSWAQQVPDDFEFAVKGGRYITHLRHLHDVEVPLANFFASGVLAMGPKLGPILWQLPRRMRLDWKRPTRFVELLPRCTGEVSTLAGKHDDKVPEVMITPQSDRPIRHALEVRHESFFVPEVYDLLREHDIALVMSDGAGAFPYVEQLTGDLVYVRLHGSKALYAGSYGDAALDQWARKIRTWKQGHDVRVYFDNDEDAAAPGDAVRLRKRLS